MGIQLLARVNGADHYDDFIGAAGDVSGRTMPRGGLAWGSNSPAGTRPVLDGNGRLRGSAQASGAGIGVVNPGVPEVIVTTRIAALHTTASARALRIIFRATDRDTHYFLSFWNTADGSQYAIGGRSAGADAGFALRTGVPPVVGDRVRIDVHAAGVADLYVNGALLGSATLPSFADRTHVGVFVNGASDSVTALEDFGVYV